MLVLSTGRWENQVYMSKRTVFFVSDHSGVTAETLGHSLITQFDASEFQKTTIPFVSTLDKAIQAVALINATANSDGYPPIVFSTLVQDDIRDVVRGSNALFLDFFDSFLGPLERELGMTSTHAMGVAHGMQDTQKYDRRIDATNFALVHDDGANPEGYEQADIILIGVSRSGKTPTCLYVALQYGVYAANLPLTEENLEGRRTPPEIAQHRSKMYGLTIEPKRLEAIRAERRHGSRYASPNQVSYEVRQAEALFERLGIPFVDTTNCSIEELASRILNETGVKRTGLA